MLNNVIDISHHNTVTSFQEVKNNGIVGVIHKATQGTTVVDSKYHARRQRALDAGLLWGAYHFGVRGNVEQQVNHFLNTTNNPANKDLLVLDFEPNPIGESGTMTLSEAERFVTLVNDRIGRFPGLYSGQSFIREKAGNRATILSQCFLWIARYSSNLPQVPPAWDTFTFWQYTDGNAGDQPHQVPGIGRCDRDKFNGSLAGLKRLWNVAETRMDINSFGFAASELIGNSITLGLPIIERLKISLKAELESRFPNMVAESWETDPFSNYTTLVDDAKDLVVVATQRVGNDLDIGVTLTTEDKIALQSQVTLDTKPSGILTQMKLILL